MMHSLVLLNIILIIGQMLCMSRPWPSLRPLCVCHACDTCAYMHAHTRGTLAVSLGGRAMRRNLMQVILSRVYVYMPPLRARVYAPTRLVELSVCCNGLKAAIRLGLDAPMYATCTRIAHLRMRCACVSRVCVRVYLRIVCVRAL